MSKDPIGERGGKNLYGFVGNDGVSKWDMLGLDSGDFWSLVSVIPFLGTLYNIIVSPPGAQVDHYKIVLSGCEIDRVLGESECKQNIANQEAAYKLQYWGLNIVHEVLDGFGCASPWMPGFVIDGAIDFLVSLYKTERISDAADKARRACVCPSSTCEDKKRREYGIVSPSL